MLMAMVHVVLKSLISYVRGNRFMSIGCMYACQIIQTNIRHAIRAFECCCDKNDASGNNGCDMM